MRAAVRRNAQMQMKELFHIGNKLTRIRNQIKAGDESEIVVWVLPGRLACSQRPLRDHPQFGGRSPLSPQAKSLVISWVERIKQMGILSIICLLENQQLERYYIRGGLGLHEGGLLGYYEDQGFEVHHFPMTDYRRPEESHMQKVLEAFDALAKPVLLHCSAAIDRTTPVAAYIACQRGGI